MTTSYKPFAKIDKALAPFANKLTVNPDGYKSLYKPQRDYAQGLFRTKMTMDDQGKPMSRFLTKIKNA